MITLHGKTQTATQWAKDYGVPLSRVSSRLHNGWPIEKALSAQKFKTGIYPRKRVS